MEDKSNILDKKNIYGTKTHDDTHKKETDDEKTETNVKNSFMVTYVLLLTTATITFIEALRTTSPTIRHIFNLETCISVVAGYFYSLFVQKIDKPGKIDWSEITKLRYLDWSITTPMMLLALCLVLSYNSKTVIHLPVILSIIALNYVMLFTGYMGETGVLERWVADIVGFIPFIAMFFIIYYNFIRPRPELSNLVLYGLYLVIWSMYGIVYMIGEEWKNIAMNFLDLTSKCLIGLGLWVYYTKIVRE
jgi:bacteriorhodopsin